MLPKGVLELERNLGNADSKASVLVPTGEHGALGRKISLTIRCELCGRQNGFRFYDWIELFASPGKSFPAIAGLQLVQPLPADVVARI